MLSKLFGLLRPRTNCIPCTWHWTVGTSFRSLMQAESQSMDARTTVSYFCLFQGIFPARKKLVGCTSIKVTTHSSSKLLDFLYKYFMMKLPEFFGYEIKFQTIEDVARRGCHRSTLKMLLRFATVICCGGVIVSIPWGVVLHDSICPHNVIYSSQVALAEMKVVTDTKPK